MSKSKSKPNNKPTVAAAEKVVVVAAADAQLDAELKELIGDATAVVAAGGEEEIVIDIATIDAEANAAATKAESYAEQEADPAGTTPVASIATARAKKAAATPKAPRVSRAAGARASAVLAASFDAPALMRAALLTSGDVEDDSLVEALKTNIDGLAKKVGDKAVNLIRFQNEAKKVQGYTRLGLAKLIADGGTTSKDLTQHFVDQKYTIGTARSQANQLMTLFPALQIATKSGKQLTLNKESVIASNFQAAL